MTYAHTRSASQDLLEWDDDASTLATPASSSASVSASPVQSPRLNELPPAKKRKTRDEVDEALIQLSKSTIERRKQKEKKEAEKQARNPEINYGLDVAETLNRFTPRQRALVKLKIQQLLFETEFPSE